MIRYNGPIEDGFPESQHCSLSSFMAMVILTGPPRLQPAMSKFCSSARSHFSIEAVTLNLIMILLLCFLALTNVAARSDGHGTGLPLAEITSTGAPIPVLHSARNAIDSRKERPHVTIESYLLEMTNNERLKNRLKPLTVYASMNELALRHSSDMCAVKRLAHESETFPAGRRRFAERMKSIGLDSGAENIAYHSYSADSKELARKIVNGWMNSHSHRVNILNASFTLVGFGTSVCKDGMIYVTQLFTDRPASSNAR